jgi:LEA14-like dessication related protein
MELQLYNPNSHHIFIQNAAANIYINDQYIGRMQLDEPIRIRRKHAIYLPMSLNIDLSKEYPILKQYASDNTVVLRLDGSVTAGKKTACITTEINYEHRQPFKEKK